VTLAANDSSVAVGEAVVFTATLPANAQPVSFTFTFDDGSAPVTQSGNAVSHAFATPGSHTVRVDVQLVGGATASAITTVTVS
jgi:PKD repeat protein